MSRWIALLVLGAVCLSGCTSVQTTSGREYLDGYASPPASRLDRMVMQAAAIEPNLVFPARIGLARVECGVLTAIPEEEAEAWLKAAETLGASFGEFVPVSLLIAELSDASRDDGHGRRSYGAERLKRTVETIRLAAARQHLDAVIIYEVYGSADSELNPASLANLTIVGAWLAPGRSAKIQGFAAALMVDVRNGYPYGTAEAAVDRRTVMSSAGSYERLQSMANRAAVAAALELVPRVEEMVRTLKAELDAQRKARAEAEPAG